MKPFIYRVTTFVLLSSLLASDHFAQTISPNIPHCGFDELIEIQRQADPSFEEEHRHYFEETLPSLSSKNRSVLEPLITVSVVVHIVHAGEPVGQGSNLSDERIDAQIAILNEDFCSLNEKFYDTPSQWFGLAGTPNIQFILASTDPQGNPTNGITRNNIAITGPTWNNNNINSEIKPMLNWDPEKYMNIYVVSIPGTTSSGGVVGYSNYPLSSQVGTDRDGPVLDFNWFGGPGFAASGYRALTHETGHYLGLPHTFNGSSCNGDDSIADTPNIDDATNAYITLDCDDSFPVGPTSCSNEHLYVNYMDYTTENCYTSFTQGQINVMRSVLDGTSTGFGYGSREGLVTNAPAQTFIPFNDGGITRLISPEIINCTPDSLVPVVTLRNFGSADLNAVNIKYQINNGSTISYSWSGNLFPGELVNVTLPAYTPPDGGYFLTCFTEMPNGVSDNRLSNDTLFVPMFTYFAFDPPMVETAEGEVDFPTELGTFDFNLSNDDFTWEITDEVSGYGFGEDCFVFNNRAGDLIINPGGTLDALITRHFDFSAVTGAAVYFDVAYAPYSAIQSDTLILLISTNCTQNFNQIVYVKGGAALATAPATQSLFTPQPLQWRTDGVDLSNYDGMDDVAIAFLNLSSWGNRLFIDNIRVGVNCALLAAEWDITPDGCSNPNGMCSGAASVTVPISNGGLSYQWEGFPTNYDEPMVSDICAGEISVTITDAFGCQIVSTEEIPGSQGPTLQPSSTDVSMYNADNGTATVTISGGTPPYSFSWSNGVNANSSFPMHTINNLAEGTYSVTVEDGNGCSSIASMEVGSVCSDFYITTFTWDVSCFGDADGSALANAFNGKSPFNYAWSNGGTTQLNVSFPAGEHTVTVTDDNGCPAYDTVLIQEPAELLLSISHTNETGLNAEDGTASASAIGGTPNYSYLWSTGATTPTVQNLAPGTYSVTLTDTNGCKKMGLVSIQSFSCDNFGASISWTDVSCFGLIDGTANVIVTGESQPLQVNWSNGSSGSIFIQNLAPGGYNVTVTDAAGCSSELSTTIGEPTEILLDLSATAETTVGANNGTATVSATGGTPLPVDNYTYLWSNGETTAHITDLTPGTYNVTVYDMNLCSSIGSIEVESSNCTLSIQMSVEDASCPSANDGTANVDAVPGGTSPFQYNWSNGQTTMTATNLDAGNYFVTVTDAVGCTVSGWVVINYDDVTPPMLLLDDAVTLELITDVVSFDPAVIDNGSFDNCSSIDLVASKSQFNCTEVGDHQVTITATDGSGNVSSANVIVTIEDNESPVLTCPADITTFDCEPINYVLEGQDNCEIELLTLMEGFEDGASFPVGTSLVRWQAVDMSGNVAECTFNVTVESTLSVDILSITPASGGLANGKIEISIEGGASPYNTTWYQNGIEIPGFDPTQVLPGEYDLEVIDANGCLFQINQIEVTNMTGVQSTSLERNISIFPNPTSSVVTVAFLEPFTSAGDIELIDLAGKVVFKSKFKAHSKIESFDLADMNAGIYWVKILVGEGIAWKKLIII